MGDGQPPAPAETAHSSTLSQWLQLMLAEIDRKREEQERGRAEAARRARETAATASVHDEPAGSENPP